MVGERGLFPFGPLLRNVVSLRSAQTSFGGSHPVDYRCKKTRRSEFLKIWSAREDYSPSGRCCATLSRFARLKPPSEVLILLTTDVKKPAGAGFFEYGRRERIRTSDPLVPNQLRYQAALLAEILHLFLILCLVRREGLEPSRPLRH